MKLLGLPTNLYSTDGMNGSKSHLKVCKTNFSYSSECHHQSVNGYGMNVVLARHWSIIFPPFQNKRLTRLLDKDSRRVERPTTHVRLLAWTIRIRETLEVISTYMLGQIKCLVQRPQHGRWIVHIASMPIAMACMHAPLFCWGCS
jgi:hypothetical protein